MCCKKHLPGLYAVESDDHTVVLSVAMGCIVAEGGVYLTGTGSTGVGSTFIALGAGYTALMVNLKTSLMKTVEICWSS